MLQNNKILLRLYINAKTKGSKKTINALKDILTARHNGNYRLEVFDILTNIDKALADNVMASPTLIKDTPPPTQKVIGMVDHDEVLSDLKIA